MKSFPESFLPIWSCAEMFSSKELFHYHSPKQVIHLAGIILLMAQWHHHQEGKHAVGSHGCCVYGDGSCMMWVDAAIRWRCRMCWSKMDFKMKIQIYKNSSEHAFDIYFNLQSLPVQCTTTGRRNHAHRQTARSTKDVFCLAHCLNIVGGI